MKITLKNNLNHNYKQTHLLSMFSLFNEPYCIFICNEFITVDYLRPPSHVYG